MACFSTPPLFEAPLRETVLEILDKAYPTKTTGMGLYRMVKIAYFYLRPFLTYMVCPPVRPCDGRTGGQTDGR